MRINHTLFLVVCIGLLTLPACAQRNGGDTEVHSVLTGNITVDAEIDTTQNYSDFEILVAVDVDGEPDTLGYTVTDRAGDFSMDITAPTRGRYSLIISRRGGILKIGVIAIAEGDSASIRAVFPMEESRPLRIRSLENAAWTAYENTTSQHQQDLLNLVQSGTYTEEGATHLFQRTSMILWGLQETFPGTMGSELAAAEAVMMVASWDDSLALAHAEEITPENISYVEVISVARGAQARTAGQEASIAFLERHAASAINERDRAALTFEIIAAHIDSMDYDLALERAQAFLEEHAGTEYEEWGKRVIYELENLIPGKSAPPLAVRDMRGDSLRLADLRGQYVLLEFYHPRDDAYHRELEGRLALHNETAGLVIVSVSMDPDTVVTEAFLESRDTPGRHVINPPGLAPLYNVNVLTTRFLIDPEGVILGKYVGSTMAAIYNEFVAVE